MAEDEWRVKAAGRIGVDLTVVGVAGERPNSSHTSLLSCLRNVSAQVMRGNEANSAHNYIDIHIHVYTCIILKTLTSMRNGLDVTSGQGVW